MQTALHMCLFATLNKGGMWLMAFSNYVPSGWVVWSWWHWTKGFSNQPPELDPLTPPLLCKILLSSPTSPFSINPSSRIYGLYPCHDISISVSFTKVLTFRLAQLKRMHLSKVKKRKLQKRLRWEWLIAPTTPSGLLFAFTLSTLLTTSLLFGIKISPGAQRHCVSQWIQHVEWNSFTCKQFPKSGSFGDPINLSHWDT